MTKQKPSNSQANRLQSAIILAMEGIIAGELMLIQVQEKWFLAVLVFAIMLATATPVLRPCSAGIFAFLFRRNPRLFSS